MNDKYLKVAKCMLAECIEARKSKTYVSVLRTITRRLYFYLIDNDLIFSPEVASQWLLINIKPFVSYESFSQRRIHIYRIASILFPNENLRPLFYDTEKLTTYEKLPLWAQKLIDDYITESEEKLKNTAHLRNHAAKFMEELLKLDFKKDAKVNCIMVSKIYLKEPLNDYTLSFIEYLHKKSIATQYAEAAYSPILAERAIFYSELNIQCKVMGYTLEEYSQASTYLITEMKKIGYSKSIIYTTNSHLNEFGIFCEVLNSRVCKETVELFLNIQKNKLKLTTHTKSRALWLIIEVLKGTTSNLFTKVFREKRYNFPSWTIEYITEYENYRKKSRLAKSTLNMDRTALLRFLNCINSFGVTSLNDITANHVQQFIINDLHSTPAGKAAYNTRIKGFLKFLYNRKLISVDLSKSLPTVAAEKVRPFKILTVEQQNQILRYCSDPNVSKRDKAILKIGMQTGLRTGDIINLRFDSVDWDKKIFRIIQQKTNSEILIPFSVGVGNALFQYITEERPQIKSKYIFINNVAPYNHYSNSIIRRILTKALHESIGFHIIRKTFASKLNSERTSFTMISEVLGHSSLDSIDAYITSDIKELKQCAIPMKNNFSYRGNLI